MKVLVVDDAKFMRLTLGNIIRKLGHEVVEAENGREALEKYREHRPDLVTMDITMPELDGVEAVKKLKQFDPGARVIMVSAMGQNELVVQAVQNGAVDFVVKPFSEDRIRDTIQKAGVR